MNRLGVCTVYTLRLMHLTMKLLSFYFYHGKDNRDFLKEEKRVYEKSEKHSKVRNDCQLAAVETLALEG